MSLYRVHLTAGLFLVLSIGYTGTVLHNTLTKSTFRYDNSIVLDREENSVKYEKFRYLDGNLDGVITKLEADNVDKYRAPLKAYDFAKSLNQLDKRLVYGLTFDVAQKAVSKLTPIEKSALLKIDLPDRVNLINSRFA